MRSLVPRLAGDAPQRASAFPIAVLALLLATRVGNVLQDGQGGQVPFTVALFVLPLLYAVPGTRGLLSRHRWLVLAVQGALTWVPFAVFGGSWQIGIGGLLAGLVLLMVPGRWSWLLAGGLLAAEMVVRGTLTAWPGPPAWAGAVATLAYYVDDALAFFATVRLAQIVAEVDQARATAAGLAVAGERLEAARELHAAVGERLASIAAMAAAAQRALPEDAAAARTQVAAAGATAREAVAQAREVTARHRGPLSYEPPAPAAGSAVIAARLAWTVLVVTLLAYATDAVVSVVTFSYGAWLKAFAITDIVVVTALQLHHSRSIRAGGRPRAWPVTLGLQAVLIYASFFPSVEAYVGGLAPFLAGSVLLLVRGRWRWAIYAAVAVSWSLLSAALPLSGWGFAGHRAAAALELTATVVGTGLVVYALARLAALTRQLEAMRGELARMAVLQERLRIARDVHDLLGLGLSAVALKADLVDRLIGRDDAQAALEIGELSRICASARADMRLVTGDGQRLSLAAEFAAARQILASAGIQVHTDIPAAPPPAVADDVLATVLREAVTNVLRHSAAATCTIEAGRSNCALRLRVCNDGVAEPEAAGERGGSGLANLTARVRAAGGQLTSRQDGDKFDLLAEIPLVSSPR